MFFFIHPIKGDFYFLSLVTKGLSKKLTLPAMEINGIVVIGHSSLVFRILSHASCSLLFGLPLPSVLCPLEVAPFPHRRSNASLS